MLITKSSNYPLGLDISDLSLKVAQFKKSGDKIRIQAIGKIELPATAMNDGIIRDEKVILESLSKLLSKPKIGVITTNEVVACLPDTKTFIKLVEVEKGPNHVSEIIAAEIEKHVPIATKDIYFDWQIISENREKYAVLIGACPRYIVDQYLDLLVKARLSVVALEIEPVAICRSLLKQESPKFKDTAALNFGIMDIGSRRSSFTIYAGGSVVLSISLPIAGDDITGRISKTLEIKKDQAEKAKIICGLDKTKAQGIIFEILADMIGNLNERIRETIEFYHSHYQGLGPIGEIILCGGGANIKNIDKMIAESLNTPTSLGNVFCHLSLDAGFGDNFLETHTLDSAGNGGNKISIRQSSSLSYATVIGLALRNMFIKKI